MHPSHHASESEHKSAGSVSTEGEDISHSPITQNGRRLGGGSVSRPIAISSVEAKRRAQEVEDWERAEIWYRNVTWQLHARIVEYREKHPLPEAYFAMQESSNERERLDQMDYGDEDWENDRTSFSRDKEDDSPFMIFDLDLEDEEEDAVPDMVDEVSLHFQRP